MGAHHGHPRALKLVERGHLRGREQLVRAIGRRGVELRPTRRQRADSRDSGQVADDEAATWWPHGTESSYGAAAAPRGRPAARRDADDAPLEVRIEFVQLDGPEGQALRRQAQIMRKVLQWIAEHPDPANQ